MTDAGAPLERPWKAVAAELSRLTRAAEIIVFGSVAKGTDGPYSDIDCMMPDDDIAAIRIALRHYGAFDPFCVSRGFLLCRNDHATGWQMAMRSRSILKAVKRDGIPLAQVLARP